MQKKSALESSWAVRPGVGSERLSFEVSVGKVASSAGLGPRGTSDAWCASSLLGG